jgi:MinD-like ATPase involved in chromosome partitioning or flagellar assembly
MIPQSKDIKHAVAQRTPVMISRPDSMASTAFRDVSRNLMTVTIPKTNTLKFFDHMGEE